MNEQTGNQGVRHAYLIMCHNNFMHLARLLQALDNEKNDIYVHVDKKAGDCPFEMLEKSVRKANLFWVKRRSVNWGGVSQIRTELFLLKQAAETYHSYYHLLSGMDFPLKSQRYIHEFFSDHQGSEFINFDKKAIEEAEFIDRVRYYYFFQDMVGRNKGKIPALCYHMQKILLSFQKNRNVDRTKKYSFALYKGTNWFSITHELVIYLLQNRKIIKRLCRRSLCADEIFLQTLVMVSPYRNNIVNDSLRYIDWKRGNPYIFTEMDYEELRKTDKLFARKFDEKVSAKLTEKICIDLIEANKR